MTEVTIGDILPCGSRAAIVELGAEMDAAALAEVAMRDWRGLVEAVPAAGSVMFEWDGPRPVDAELLALVSGVAAADRESAPREPIEIAVSYDGEDLDHVAAQVGMSREEVVELHSGAIYTSSFCGFAPGFAYLTGLPEPLRLPRRSRPRSSVPAGSVAIAAGYSAIYPSDSPGGWHLLGATEARVFDPDAAEPVLLRPGTRVRFVP